MPHFNHTFFPLLKNYNDKFFSEYKTFIETGTHLGNTTFAMEPYFEKIHTIEIKKYLFENTKSKYKGNKIQFHLGDSSILLKDICLNIKTPAVFFLDGHWSCGNTGKGSKDVPLYEELHNIINFFENKAIIIIDDFRLFGKGPKTNTEIVNWEDINKNKVLDIVNKRLSLCYNLPSNMSIDDRLILHIDKLT
tara:strand:+ start:39 stop:614 length:576 start_codon:yes stop_codon:yes gene_type:complete